MSTSAKHCTTEDVMMTMASVLVLGLSAVPPVLATTAIASATVIEGINVTTSMGSLTVIVSRSGSWVKVATPSAQPQSIASNSSTSSAGNTSAATAPLSLAGSLMTPGSIRRQAASDGTVQGDTVSTLSWEGSAAGSATGGSVNITVAFN